MPSAVSFFTRCATVIGFVLITACATTPPIPPVSMASETPAAKVSVAKQMLLVSTPSWEATKGELHRFERINGQWVEIGQPFVVNLGRNGSAWGTGLHPMPQPGPHKKEGDGRSPAGVFLIGDAFGYDAQLETKLNYRPMQPSHYCIDVPTSPLYTQIVDTKKAKKKHFKGATEPMRLDLHNNGDKRYAKGFVIAHNPKAVAGDGSCIFAHLQRNADETTAGCTAMPEAEMDTLLGWLDASQYPVFVLLPENERARLTVGWRLPAMKLIQ